MPVQPTYPGVYIEEIPSGVRTIVGVATSITAFIGRARRGPVDKYKVVNNFGDFQRIFGGLWVDSRLGYAVQDFFTNGGGQAIIVRVYHDSSGDLTTGQTADAALKEADKAKTASDALDLVDAGFPNPLPDGDPRAGVHDLIEGAKAEAGEKLEDARAAMLIYFDEKITTAAQTLADKKATVPPDPAAITAATDAFKKANNNKAAAQTDDLAALKALLDPADAPQPAAGAAPGDGYAKLDAKGLALKANAPGKWGNYLRSRVTKPNNIVARQLADQYPGTQPSDFFNLSIHDTGTGKTEPFVSLVAKAGHRRDVTKILETQSQLVIVDGDADATTPTGSHSEKPAAKKNIWNDDTTSTAASQDGSDGGDIKTSDIKGDESAKTGLYALEDADLFNLLYIPPYIGLDDTESGGDIDYSLVGELEAYCMKRRAMLILDPPSAWSTKDKAREGMQNAETQASTTYSAVFFPRLREPNSERDGQIETFGVGGAIAGIMARTDVERGVWKAPAGLDATFHSVPALKVKLSNDENGELNPLGLNTLRAFPSVGRVVWGSRTSRGADLLSDQYKYIPVRRTALFIEESLYRATQWVVFEPNDERTWAAIRLNVGAFMHDLFKKGAFQIKSSNARDSYFVKCDAETTTQNDINLGIVNIVVGFQPLQPVEFVIIKFQQIAGDIET